MYVYLNYSAMQFVKMVQFARLVKVDGRLREFNFRKLKSKDKDLFNVNVCNERGDRFIFEIQKKENTWAIQSEVPNWVMQSENNIGAVIDDELSSGNWPR